MTIRLAPTAARKPSEQRTLLAPSNRAIATGLIVAGLMAALAMAAWVTLGRRVPHLPHVWRVRAFAGIEATPVLAGDLLVVACCDGTLIGLDAATGETRYHVAPALLAIAGGLTLADGIVYFGSDDGGVYAVNPATGETLASAKTKGPVRTAPLVYKDRVYVGSDDGHLWTFTARKLRPVGEPRYMKSAIHGSPVLAGEEVAYAPIEGNLCFLDPERGSLRHAVVRGPIHSSPGAGQGYVWIGNDAGELFAVNPTTLEVKRVATLPAPIRAQPVASRGMLLVGCNDGVLRRLGAASVSGHVFYSVATGGAVRAPAVLSRQRALFVSDDGALRVIDQETGALVGIYRAGGGRISAAPVLGESGLVYVATAAGEVHAVSTLAVR